MSSSVAVGDSSGAVGGKLGKQRPPRLKQLSSNERELLEEYIRSIGHVPSFRTASRVLKLSVSATRNYLVAREDSESTVDEDLQKYREAFNRALPIEQRVKLWVELAQGDSVAQRRYALERIDQLSGVLSAKERKDAATPVLTPMFTLPPGATVALGKRREED